MWEPQPLTTLRASKACRGENFTLLRMEEISLSQAAIGGGKGALLFNLEKV
jgi:hypothetical protein